ncbi:hypothetical protein COP2_013834 [Malus domestica]
MKKVHIALGILAQYSEWHWLLNPIRQEKGKLSPKEEIKQMKDEALAHPIAAVEPTTNKGGKKRYSLPTCEPSTEKKPKTSFGVCGGSSAVEKLVIDLTSPKPTNKFVEPVKPVAPKMATCIAERIAQRKGSVVPPVSWFVLKSPSGAKFDLASERLAAMKSDKVDSIAKAAPGPVPHSIATSFFAEKGKSAHMGNCEKSTDSEAREFPKVCALLKATCLRTLMHAPSSLTMLGKS